MDLFGSVTLAQLTLHHFSVSVHPQVPRSGITMFQIMTLDSWTSQIGRSVFFVFRAASQWQCALLSRCHHFLILQANCRAVNVDLPLLCDIHTICSLWHPKLAHSCICQCSIRSKRSQVFLCAGLMWHGAWLTVLCRKTEDEKLRFKTKVAGIVLFLVLFN